MRIYKSLSRICFLKNSYSLKFLFIAFLGIHIPLISLIIFFVSNKELMNGENMLWYTLLITLIASAITLAILRKLVAPITHTSKFLEEYRKNRLLINLPYNYTDEAGILMRNIQDTVTKNILLANEKTELITLLSHDLKNYASNPELLAKLIIDEDNLQEIKNYATLIVEFTKQQVSFLESFIFLLKTEDILLKHVEESTIMPIEKILKDIAEENNQKIQSKECSLKIISPLKNLHTNFDENLLKSVLTNLVDNAFKFSNPKGLIEIIVQDNPYNYEIIVQDNGIGFAPTQADKIFEKFTKMSRLGTKGELSTGIGLYLCKTIVQKFNGTITATSKGQNMGSTFTISLNKL